MSWIITGSQKVNWTPAQITTLLWLDSADSATIYSDAGSTLATNGSAVQQWNDKSGNGRNVSQSTLANRPTLVTNSLNSFAGLDWGTVGNNKILTASVSSYSPARYYGVADYDGANPHGDYYCLIGHNRASASDELITEQNTANWYATSTLLNGSASSSVALPTTLSPFIFATDYGPNASRTSLGIGGELRFLGGRSWVGKIYEIVATPIVLPDYNRQVLEGYFAHKWGLTANLPNDHPFKVNPPAP